jgi:hypothetical protein
MAFPTFQAAGAFVESATAAVSPAWPAHAANDIGFLLVHSLTSLTRLSVTAGFRELPVSPQVNGIENFRVYWKRATGAAEAAPTVTFDNNHVRAVIITFRGCSTVGRPFTTCAGKDAAPGTAVTFPAITTTDADSLVVDILGFGLDSAGAKLSGWANASLAVLTERMDDCSIIGDGAGFAVSTGQKAVAGAVNATTATLAASSDQQMITLALSALEQSADKMPYLKDWGVPVESATVAVNPAWPPHVTGDVALLLVESGGWPATLSVPAGFVEVPNSPQNGGVSGTDPSTQLSVYWARATSGAMAAPTVDFTAKQVRALIVTFGNCINAGDPYDITSGSGTGPGSNPVLTYDVPGGTTILPNELVVAIGSNSRDVDSGANYSAWVNASLQYVTERYDRGSLIGSGSGFGVATGEKPAAGVVDTFTANLATTSNQGRVMVALKGLSGGDLAADRVDFSSSVNAASLLHDRVIPADPVAFALTIFDAESVIIRTFTLEADRVDYASTLLPVDLTKSSQGWTQQLPKPTTWTKQPPKVES